MLPLSSLLPLLVATFFFFSVSCEAAPAYIQANAGTSFASPANVLGLPRPATIGNVVVVGIDSRSNSQPALDLDVSDDANNQYFRIGSYKGIIYSQFLYWARIVNSPSSWTFTATGSSFDVLDWHITEYSGIANVGPAEVNGISDNSTVTVPSRPVDSNKVVVSCLDSIVIAFGASLNEMFADTAVVNVRSTQGINVFGDINVTTLSNYGFTVMCDSPELAMMVAVANGQSCPSFISDVAAGQTVTITGDAVVTSSVINGTLIVTGNCVMPASTVLGPNAIIQVGANATLSSSLVVTQGASIIVGGRLVFLPGSVLSPVVTALPAGSSTSVTFRVANYSSISGQPSIGTATLGTTPPPGQCATLSSSTSNIGSTSLTITVSISVSPCSAPAGLSTGAIIGIAVGAACGGILLVVGIVLLSVYLVRKYERDARSKITQRKLEDLQEV